MNARVAPRHLRHRIESALQKPPALRTSILGRMVRQSLLLTTVTVLALVFLSGLVIRSLLTDRAIQQISTVAATQENLLAESVRFDRERLGLIAARLSVRGAVGVGSPNAEALFEELRSEAPSIRGIALANARGQVIDTAGNLVAVSQAENGVGIRPVVDRRNGWIGTDITSPVRDAAGRQIGTISAQFDVTALLGTISSTVLSGESGQLSLGEASGSTLRLVYRTTQEPLRTIDVGSLKDPYVARLPMARAALGAEGIVRSFDNQGRPVLAAYRFLPSLGWGLTVELPTTEAFAGLEYFTLFLLAAGVLLLGVAAVFSFALARHFTSPILSMASRMQMLNPGHWQFRRDVHTGDEMEILDHVTAELTNRLRTTYEHLEEEVADRTEDLRKQFLLDRTILERIEYAVIIADPQGRITDVNPAAEMLLQRKREHLIGAMAAEAIRLQSRGKDVSPASHPVTKVLKDRRAIRASSAQRLSVLASEGAVVPVLASITPLMSQKTLNGVVLILQDRTEERKIEQMKSDFITLASHQLRTPLSSIRWYLELLSGENAGLSKDQRAYLEEMLSSAQRMAGLLDDLLHVAHLEEGEIKAEFRETDIGKLIEGLLPQWKDHALQHGRRCEFVQAHGSMKVQTDQALLGLVLQNVFSNAVKYSDKGSAIRVTVERSQKETLIIIQNKGMGIPEEDRKHVFEKFFRTKNAKAVDAEGSGLGLYLCKAIMQNLDGRISFTSQVGKGTSFTIAIPVPKKKSSSTTAKRRKS